MVRSSQQPRSGPVVYKQYGEYRLGAEQIPHPYGVRNDTREGTSHRFSWLSHSFKTLSQFRAS